MTQAFVTSATTLSADQKKKLLDGLRSKFGKLELVEQIDEEVIAGVKISIGSTMIDSSVKGKLNQLRASVIDDITSKS